uniref:C-type lectin domain-containing protein n=1 Tax=Salmo trutta TaxID=8032 RepID=A0A674DMT9_SALTR
MEKAVCTALLLSNVLGEFRYTGYGGNPPYISVSGKHVYVHDKKSWLEAQKFCKEHYTDLSSISSVREQQQLQSRGDWWINYSTWIGLYREPNNITGWRWSGGGYDENLQIPFFCLKLIVVRESKTWEEALEYCREKHIDLTSHRRTDD